MAPVRLLPPRPGLFDPLLAAVFPGRCPGCGRPAEPLCGRCAAGAVAPAPAPPPPGVDAWVAPFAYDGVIRELVARAKFHGRHAGLRWLAARMAEAWRAAALPRPTLVTAVPAVPSRRRARGLDPAGFLARDLAGRLGIPHAPLLVRRDRGAQTARALSDRRRGPVVEAGARVAGAVLLVDDVTTTGATLRQCARALRAAGATGVQACTAARTPPDRAR